MAVRDIVPVPGTRFEGTLESASPDLLREMIRAFAQRMMDAEVGPDRVNSRNGYRRRDWDTRAGTIEVAVPKLRQGTYYPEWFLERRRRAERALATGRGDVVPAGRLDAAGGEARRVPGRDEAVEVAGQRHGGRARRYGDQFPVPAAGRRPVRVLLDRRADPEGPRGRPHGERARPDRDRGERGREAGDPRTGRRQLGGRGGVAGVPARPGRPRPVRRASGHLRLPPRAAGRDRRGPAGRVLAKVPRALRRPRDYADLAVGVAGGSRVSG